MQKRTLGPWQIPPIGLGCMNVSWAGRAATDPTSRIDSAIPGIHAALDAGITLLDTADIYAPTWDSVGHNEIFVREALDAWSGSAAKKAEILIATKGGITRSVGEVWGRNGSLEHMLSAAEASRERLQVDVIDLWQHHRLDPNIDFETQFENVLEVKARGLVKQIGVSNYNAAQVRKAVEIGGTPSEGGIISVQNEFSPMYRHDLDVLEVCEEFGIAFLPWSPLGGSKKVELIGGEGTGKIAHYATEKGVSPQALTLAWLLAYSPVIIPIPGATRVESVRDSASAWDISLTAAEVEDITSSLGDMLPRSEELDPTPPFRN
jgi:aryl-alcohol dehydrogenase-like predicted oxidoreductase